MKKIFSLILIVVLFLMAIACGETKLSISGKSEVEVGCSILLTHNYQSNYSAEWVSSDESIAIVTDGMVIGVNPGEVIILLTIGEKQAIKTITVTEPVVDIIITGVSSISVGSDAQFSVTFSKEIDAEVEWKSSNNEVATVSNDGKVTAITPGEVTIFASYYNNKSEFKVIVIERPGQIVVNGPNKIIVGDTSQLTINTDLENENYEFVFSSSNELVAQVDENGIVTAISEGNVVITVALKDDIEVYTNFEIEIIKSAPEKIVVIGENEMIQGAHNYLSVEVIGKDVTNEVEWRSSDNSIAIVYQGIVLGVNKGKVNITAHSVADENVYGSIEIEVTQYVSDDETEEDLDRVNQIIFNMTLNEKIGQMFAVGFNGTTMSSELSSVIEEYNFGNVIYMGHNVTSPSTLSALSNSIQSKIIEENGVPAFISIDQEGGRVARLTNGGTHFISNMAMGATGDYNNTYLEGKAMGLELKNYGINSNFAPVLDVNNNPENPVIGIRSYSDNPLLVSLYGKNMFLGLQESGVMGCGKHFPGHGNTYVDSHYGLPTITTSIDELYQTEIAPFVSAISNGIDAIMTTHIIFTAIDSEYPATLSEKVLTGLLREEIGYNGLIITDGMEMAAVANNFGGYDQTAILAVKAGVDMLLYTSNTNPRIAHDALVEAVNNGEITEERINESVRRILLKKLKYGILDDYFAKDEDISELLITNESLNISFAMNSLTLVKGEFNGLDKNKSTLIISPTTTFNLGEELNSNSFANYACNYLKENGHTNCDYVVISVNATNTEINNILNKVANYDQIVIAASNVKTSKYTNTASLVNKLTTKGKELLVIALDTPYDLMSYSGVNNYVCVYGYQKATVIALSKYLNGEFIAKGSCAVSEEIFK